MENEVRTLLRDKNVDAITTMYDYYGLPDDFPGYTTLPGGNSLKKAIYLENQFKQKIADERFKPYFQLHEFETILFVEPNITAQILQVDVDPIREIKNSFNSPEEINDGVETCPSKRIINLFPRYEKPLYGLLISAEMGLENIRKECNHFDTWITWLETLG